MSLLGAKQVAGWLRSPSAAPRDAQLTFDASTVSMGQQMGDMLQALFLAGDSMQREVTDLIFSMMTPEVFDPRSEINAEVTQVVSETFRNLNPAQNGMLTLQELRNKAAVFGLVYRVPSILELAKDGASRRLTEPLKKAYDQDEYSALWVVEGLGHFIGDTYTENDEVPRAALSEAVAGEIDAKSLTMLHAGVGMAITQRWMKSLNHRSSRSDVRVVVERIIEDCKASSEKGYEGATLESLGLITRNGQFYGETRPDEMVAVVSAVLREIDEKVYDYFWHGVGRATYFLPINFVPGYGSIWHALELARREAVDVRARLNSVAGLSWGVTMVNIRHPEIVAILLEQLGEDHSKDHQAFSNGVVSGLIMRADTTPGAAIIDGFCEYLPEDEALAAKWSHWVQKPCRLALEHYHPKLAQHQCLGEIFRYHSLERLIDELTSERHAKE